MSGPAHRLLLVHAGASFCSSVSELMRPIGGFEIDVLPTSRAAVEHLLTRSCDVLVVLQNVAPGGWLPVVTAALRQNPRVSTVVVCPLVSDSVLTSLADHPGWTDLLEEPLDRTEARTVLLAAASASQVNVMPSLRQSVLEFAEYMALEGRSAVVRARWPQGAGSLIFEMGRLAHASIGTRSGIAAMRIMMAMGDGLFAEAKGDDHSRYQPNISVGLGALAQLEPDDESAALPVSGPPCWARTAQAQADVIPLAYGDDGSSVLESSAINGERHQTTATGEGGQYHQQLQHAGEHGGVAMNMDKLNQAVETLKDRLGVGLVACDIWGPDGFPMAGYNQQPAAAALFGDITKRINTAMAEASYPGIGRYYMLELAGKKLACVMIFRDHQWGCLVDLEKVNMGMLISVAMPKALEDLRAAVEG